jgi:Domain of unknown function (DUF4272)
MRSAEQAITRALCLAAVVTRANAEYLIGSGEPAPAFAELAGVDPKDAPSRIDRWLSQEGLTTGLSPQERFWMSVPSGTWSKQNTLNASWRREGLTVLLWGLQVLEPMPSADAQIDIVDLLQSAWLLKDTKAFREMAKLRFAEEINKTRDAAEFWLWRARTTQLQESPDALIDPRTSKKRLEEIISHAAETGERKGLFKRVGGDFPAFGKPFRDLNQAEWSLIRSICVERLYGLNWLCDIDGLEWDDVDTST